jgi:tellurite resistance protein
MSLPTKTDSYRQERLIVWVRGLLAIAWVDGDFSASERQTIVQLTRDLSPEIDWGELTPIDPAQLAGTLGDDPNDAENFLRMATAISIADGVYTIVEDRLLREYFTALKIDPVVLDTLNPIDPLQETTAIMETIPASEESQHLDVLHPVRAWLDNIKIEDPQLARFLCRLIPSQCPFERDIVLFGHKIVHIPPLCKINPLYEECVGLRFRALCFLADVCQEDVTTYC